MRKIFDMRSLERWIKSSQFSVEENFQRADFPFYLKIVKGPGAGPGFYKYFQVHALEF